MNGDQWLIIYMLGLLMCAGSVIEGVDQMHNKSDQLGNGAEIYKALGEKAGAIYIDVVGTAVILLWPLSLLMATLSFLRSRK